MESYLQAALDIVKAQAGVRTMTEEEMVAMMRSLSISIRALCGDAEGSEGVQPLQDADKAIREKEIICVECGKSFRILTARHLATHNLTPETYREKFGYAKGMPLLCKSLQRERRKKMCSMKLWERREK